MARARRTRPHPGTPKARPAGVRRTANRGTLRSKGDLYIGRFVTSPAQARVSAPKDVREDQLGRRMSHLPPRWSNEGGANPSGKGSPGRLPALARRTRAEERPPLPSAGPPISAREQWLGQKEARRFRPAPSETCPPKAPGADGGLARDLRSPRVLQGSRAWRPEDRGPRTGARARPARKSRAAENAGARSPKKAGGSGGPSPMSASRSADAHWTGPIGRAIRPWVTITPRCGAPAAGISSP